MTIIRRTLRSYQFKDKDPIKDEMQTALEDAGLFDSKDTRNCKRLLKKLAILANVSYQTLENLFFGDTKRPQNATVEGTLRAAGLERVIRTVRKIKDIDAEVKVARAWNRKEAARIARLNAKPGMGKKRRPRKGAKKVTHLRLVKSA